MTAFLVALVPSAGVLLVFWIAVKALLEADRRERNAQARIEAAQRLQERGNSGDRPVQSAPAVPPAAPSTPGAGDAR